MNKSFKGEFISFFNRLLKRLAPVILLLAFTILKMYNGNSFSKSLGNYRTHFLILLIICFLYGVYYHTNKIRTVVNEVQFTDDRFLIIGQDFSSKYEDNLDLNKIMIEIQLEEIDKAKTRFCLEIYCDDKYYYLNKFSDWKYKTLIEIVDEYKLRTGKTVSGMEYYSQLNVA